MLGQLGLHFFSVCDGHGLNGHHVSAYIKEKLPAYFEQKLIVHTIHWFCCMEN